MYNQSLEIYLVRNDFRKENDMISNVINVCIQKIQYILDKISVFILYAMCASKYLLLGFLIQSEINSNATVTNLLFSVIPQNASENSESSVLKYNQEEDHMICHLSEYNFIDQSSAPFVPFKTVWRAPRGKKMTSLPFEQKRIPISKGNLITPIFFEPFTLMNKFSTSARLFFYKNAVALKLMTVYFPIIYTLAFLESHNKL